MKNRKFQEPFLSLKLCLIKEFIGSREKVRNIVNRPYYYVTKNTNVKTISESCTSKMFRVVFTNKPPPYYTDYNPLKNIDDNSNFTDLLTIRENVMYEVRELYGFNRNMFEEFSSYNSGSNSENYLSLNRFELSNIPVKSLCDSIK